MLDCKPLVTPMLHNLKLSAELDSNLVDPSLFKHMIGSMMYLVNTKFDISHQILIWLETSTASMV
jgi:hypothetical protein